MLTPHILKATGDTSAELALQDIANVKEGTHNEAQVAQQDMDRRRAI